MNNTTKAGLFFSVYQLRKSITTISLCVFIFFIKIIIFLKAVIANLWFIQTAYESKKSEYFEKFLNLCTYNCFLKSSLFTKHTEFDRSLACKRVFLYDNDIYTVQ